MANKFSLRRKISEFKPDSKHISLLKRLYMTKQQRLELLKWGLYTVVCLLLLVVQDVILCRVSIFGGGTDLCVSAILLITVLEGTESGSIFALVASLMYLFSGSAPGPYCVALITFLGIGAAMFRQLFWQRTFTSIVFCSGIVMVAYEMIVFIIGILMRLTLFSRVSVFAVTGLIGWVVMLPLYPICYKIGKIGGTTWKD